MVFGSLHLKSLGILCSPLLRASMAASLRSPARGFHSSRILRSASTEGARGIASQFSLPRLLGVLAFGSLGGVYLEYEKAKKQRLAGEKEDEKKRKAWEEGLEDGEEDKPVSNLSAMGGPFTLTDEDGVKRSERDYRGRFMFMYFGYTFCPDICPNELKKMAETLEILEQQGEAEEIKRLMVPMFVSVDPHRDSIDQIKLYTKEFHPRLVGLTGTEEELKVIAKAYGVYVKIPSAEDRAKDKEYIVDHSIFTFLVGPDGNLVDYFSHELTPKAMAKSITRKIAQWKAKEGAKVQAAASTTATTK